MYTLINLEIRLNYLSYQVQRIQRNKYIAGMLIYATVVLGAYIGLLYHVYDQRGDYKGDSVEKVTS